MRTIDVRNILLFLPIFILTAEGRDSTSLTTEGIPAIPEKVSETVDSYQNIRAASMQAWLPGNEGILILTRFAESNQVHRVSFPVGARRQLTFFADPVEGISDVIKTPYGFLFLKDRNGNEQYQIYFYNLQTGKIALVTDGVSRNESPVLSNGGKHFAYASTKRNGKDFDLYIADIRAPGGDRLLLETSGIWAPVDWDPGDSLLLAVNFVSAGESHYHIINVRTGVDLPFDPDHKKLSYGAARWSRNSKGIYYISDDSSEFQQLRCHDFASGKSTVLTGSIEWDIDELQMSPDRRMAAFTVNEDGVKRLYTVSTANNTIRKLKVPLGQIYNLRFSDDNRQIAFTIGSAKNPGDVYAYTISSGSLKRWTFSETGGLPADSFVEPQLVHYTSFDSVNGTPRLIPAFLYKPHGASAVNQTGTFPVLIQIHGGPETQYVPSFSPVIQYFVRELGIAVIAPNVRGSSGYGKTFLTLDNGYKRQDAVKDIGRLLDWIGKQPDLDSGRVAVMGKSYGGFMTFASMAAYNSRLRCGISTAGISSFVTFLNNTAEHRRDARRVEYGDERDAKMRAFFETVSPLSNAGRITKPLFIAQGSNDPRVPVSEARQMQKAIQKNGAPVWFMLAPDEGHGFAKKSNSDYFTSAVSMFLRKYLFAAFDHVK